MEADRLTDADELLREVVYRSRERQAGVAAFPATPGDAGRGRCGLGERAAVDLDLSPRGVELYARIFAADPSPARLAEVQAAMSAWVERQDALDRKRNHFLKDFRHRHGFDRASYSAELLAEFEGGLARIGTEEDAERRRAAEQVVALAERAG